MEEKPLESFQPAKSEKPLTEWRVALISVLISVPAAFLIAMLIHYFVSIPEQPLFASEPVVIAHHGAHEGPNVKRPAVRKPKTAGKKGISALYEKKIGLCKANLKAAKGGVETVQAQAALLLAEGELFRYENKIRRWGNSISDLAVKADAAKHTAALLKGKGKAANDAEIAAVDLEIQLKNHRNFSNEDWKSAYSAFLKDPGVKTYKAMLEAEQAAQPPRRF